MTKLIQQDLLTPELLSIFHEWGVPSSEFTADLYAFAKVVQDCPDSRVGDMVVSFGFATQDEVERHAATKPANILFLEHLADKIEGLRPNTQKLLAANDNLAFYETISSQSVHVELHNNKALREFCSILNCIPLNSSNPNSLRLVFSDYAALKEYRERSRIKKLSDPIGILCTAHNLTLIYAIAQRDQIATRLYAEHGEATNAVENEDQQIGRAHV